MKPPRWITAAACAPLLLGAAHLGENLWPIAWVGLVALGVALRDVRHHDTWNTRQKIAATVTTITVARFVETVTTEHWLYRTLRAYLRASPGVAVGGVMLLWTLSTLVRATPAVLLVVGLRRSRIPIACRWATGMTVGELLWHHLTTWSWSDHLYAHGADPWVWRGLVYLGWVPTCMLAMTWALSLGHTLAANRPRRTLVWILAAVAVRAMPMPASNPARVRDVYAAAMPDLDAVVTPPPGTHLVVLPEVAIARRASLLDPGRLDVPVVHTADAPQVLGGGIARDGEHLANVAWTVDARGTAMGVHVKTLLVPGGERPVFGVTAGTPFVQGTKWDVLTVGGHRVVPLICLEALDRGWMLHARQEADVIAVLASDRPLEGSHVAQTQAENIAKLRSVESGLPLVRASLGGVAGTFLQDGHVLRSSSPAA